jgi:hypothetical protein
VKILVFRRYRGAWFSREWHNYNGVTYVKAGISHPRKHKWWAIQVYLYLRGA